MPAKVRRIKRSMLEELGDGYEVLTDELVQEGGFTLADDEVIVVEKPAPATPQGESADVTELRTKLHTVNAESAERRIKLKEAQSKIAAQEAELATLKSTVTAHKLDQAKQKATTLFEEVVKDKKIAFVSDEAAADVRNEIFTGIDWQQEVTKDSLMPLVEDFTKKKPYVLKTVTLQSTEGGRRSKDTSEAVPIDLEEVARAFNLPAPPKNPPQEGTT